MGVIVDTCVWIDVERGMVSPGDVELFTRQEPVFISPVTIAELTFGVEMAQSDAIRQKRSAALDRLKRKPVLVMDEETGSVFGRISSNLKKLGRVADFRVQDVWMSSQAVQHNFSLLTRNGKDFEDIPGLQIILFVPK